MKSLLLMALRKKLKAERNRENISVNLRGKKYFLQQIGALLANILFICVLIHLSQQKTIISICGGSNSCFEPDSIPRPFQRDLAASAVSSPSTIKTTDTITVTATDTDGTGQIYEISWNNECTVSAPGLTCTAAAGQEQVLDSASSGSMTDNGDGTYTSTKSVTRPGKITINVFKYTQGGVLVEYYSGTSFGGSVQFSEIKSNVNINYGTGNLFGSTSNSASAKIYFKLKGPSTESITMQLNADDLATLSLGGSNVVTASLGTNSNSFSSTLNQLYDGQIDFVEVTNTAHVIMSWSYTSVSMTTVPGSNLYYKAYVSSPMQLTVNCPDGYSKTTSGGRPVCQTVCGDGKRAGSEECDDGNSVATVDGCTSSCAIDTNWVCSGGTPTAQDTCTQCSAGYDPNINKDTCVTTCGDGKRAGSEECDDGNSAATVDGCTSSCTIVSGWECHDGTPTAQDVCTQCGSGFVPNAAKDACVTVCGDGKRAGSEECDDGNLAATVDGCDSSCAIDSGWICVGGSPTVQDSCTQCSAGLYPNTAKTVCEPHCGDSKRAGSETCDDGNLRNGDGCTAACVIETNWICNGGTTSTADTCTFCEPGYTANNTPATQICETTCGDRIQVGTEKCDDGNTAGSDGCAADCSAVDSGWVCSNSSFTSGDTCTQCSSGLYQNDATYPTSCVPQCGDSKRAGNEKCDNGDATGATGCSSDCMSITSGWVCSGGTPTTADTCTQCTAGLYQNDETNPTTCVPQCGDGLEAGSEKCDDGNTVAGDGCAADCSTVEAGWVCTGGSTTSEDECYKCADGYSQNNAANPTTCVTTCGDGFEAGTEKCDDGNKANSDGCAGDCSTVESGWVCIGGSPTTSDICTQCTSGFYQNDAINPEVCVTRCGDGLEAGTEKCDDGNTFGNDGCAADCSTVEVGWVCIGGSTSSQDVCTQCTAGFYQDDSVNPETCVTICGDGFEAGTEKCDDSNTISGDGCTGDCSTVESGWVCKYGSPTTVDVCEQCSAGYIQNSQSNPEYCVPSCGDGLRVGDEICDDGNTNNEDGCSSSCSAIEKGYICVGGSINSQDKCIKCPASHTPDIEQRKCDPKSISSQAEQLGILLFIMIGIGIILNILMIHKFEHSYFSIFSLIFHTQMLYLLPMIGSGMQENTFGMLRLLKFILLSFNELPHDWIFFGYTQWLSFLEFDQKDYYLDIIGFSSGSSAINLHSILWICIIFSILFLALILVPENFKIYSLCKTLKRIMTRISVRLLMVCLVYIVIATCSEISEFSHISKEPLSYFISCVILGSLLALVIFGVPYCFHYFKEAEPPVILKEIFEGIKESPMAKLYVLLWIIKRIFFVGVIFMLTDLNEILFLAILMIFQLFYLLAILQLAPFQHGKDLIIEVYYEGLYLCLLPISLYYSPPIDSASHGTIYTTINVFSVAILAIILTINLFKMSRLKKPVKPDQVIRSKRPIATPVTDKSSTTKIPVDMSNRFMVKGAQKISQQSRNVNNSMNMFKQIKTPSTNYASESRINMNVGFKTNETQAPVIDADKDHSDQLGRLKNGGDEIYGKARDLEQEYVLPEDEKEIESMKERYRQALGNLDILQ